MNIEREFTKSDEPVQFFTYLTKSITDKISSKSAIEVVHETKTFIEK